MSTQSIDLSAGLVPKPISDIDLSAGLVPKPTPADKPGFFQSFADASGLSSAAHAIAHPIQTLMPAVDLASDVVHGRPADDNNPIVKTVQGLVKNTVDQQKAEKEAFNQGQYGAAASHALLSVPIVGQVAQKAMDQTEGNSTQNSYGQNLKALVTSPGAMGTLAGAAASPVLAKGAAEAAPEIVTTAGKTASIVGDAAQDAGVGVINKTVGALKADFKRGANPGRGYLSTDNGPVLTMQGLADNAADAKDAIGTQLSADYQKATDAGVKIPVETVAQEMAKPLQKAIDLETGPGGTGNVATIQNYVEQFAPTFDKAAANGGFTPKELFDMKRSIAQNTNWSDPTQFSLKAVRQQQTGALSGILSDAVPELSDLNQHYQDLSNFAERAADRAKTGSSPLTALATKIGTMGAVGASGSHFGPAGAAAGAAAGALIDSIPFKTTLATGLYRGGRLLSAAGERLTPADSATVEGVSANSLKNDASGDNANQPQNPQGTPPQLPNGSTTGPAAWASSGAQKLVSHLSDNPGSGVTADDIASLAKTDAGQRVLINASDLSPGSAAMKNLVKQIKASKSQ